MKGKIKQIFAHIFNVGGVVYSMIVGIIMLGELDNHPEELLPGICAIIFAVLFAVNEAINIVFIIKRKYHVIMLIAGIAISAIFVVTGIISNLIVKGDEAGILLLIVIPAVISVGKAVFDVLIFKDNKTVTIKDNG